MKSFAIGGLKSRKFIVGKTGKILFCVNDCRL